MNRNGCVTIFMLFIAIFALTYWFFLREPLELPAVENNDAGNYSFVRQAVPLLQGRKVKGYDEIKLLADLAAATNRRTLVEMLTTGHESYQKEYIDNWSDIIVDWMRVHRETPKNQSTCFGNPSLANINSDLSRYIVTNTPDATASGYSISGSPANFNMSDVLRSSLHDDNLSSAYLAYLFPLVNKPIGGAEVTEQNRRTDLGATFTHVYTNRQMGCLSCHTTVTSKTGPESRWNRHFPIFGNSEKALFGFNTGRDPREVEALLRTDVKSGLVRPWGIDQCGSFTAKAAVPNDSLVHTDTGMNLESYLVSNHGRTGSVWTIEDIFRNGIQGLSDGYTRGPDVETASSCQFCASSCNASNPIEDADVAAREAAVQTIVSSRCVTCHLDNHDGWNGSNWKDAWIAGGLVTPGDSASSAVIQRVISTSNPMPPAYAQPPSSSTPLTIDEVNTIRDWIDGLVDNTGDCSICGSLLCDENVVDGNEAFAYLVANKIVSNTWNEVFGQPLTIANYFSRNSGQGTALWNLTENTFLSRNWSLQALLTEMLDSDYFNRKPPQTSTTDYAYDLPLLFDPWVESDPRFPPIALPGWEPSSDDSVSSPFPERDLSLDRNTNTAKGLVKNAMTEAVHRYNPRSLLYSMHASLGWPEPKRFGGSAYPSSELQRSLGQFWRDAEPGFREIDFQGLLMWETLQGQCQKPANHTGDDWIDRIVDQAEVFNTSNPGAGASYRDLVISLKDWLLGNAQIQTNVADTPQGLSETENQSLVSYFGSLTNPVALATNAQKIAVKNKLRGYCGVLVQTPQFMLAGIAPTELGEKPRLRQCNNADEFCSYQEMCNSFKPAMAQQGYTLECQTESINVSSNGIAIGLPGFCFGSRCKFIDSPKPLKCLLDPRNCQIEPPSCDLGCKTIDCCGGPLPPIDLDRPGYMLGQFDGAKVDVAEGIKVRRQDTGQFEALNKGEILKTGDLVALSPKGNLELSLNEEKLKTPKGGIPLKGKQGTWYLIVTSAQAAKPAFRQPKVFPKVPKSYIYEGLNTPWNKYGEAGAPRMGGQVEEPDNERSLSFTPGEIIDPKGLDDRDQNQGEN